MELERSNDLISWTPVSTNVMPSTVYPSIAVTDSGATNSDVLFYRVSEFP